MIQNIFGDDHTNFKSKFDILFNSHPKDSENNRNIVLFDSSITENLKEIKYAYQLLLYDSSFQKFRWKHERNGSKNPVLHTGTVQFILMKQHLRRRFTHKNGQLQIKSIQSKEHEQTLNAMCLGSLTSQEFQLLNCLKEVSTVIKF